MRFLLAILTFATVFATPNNVLISGSGGGIGVEAVKCFHEHGWKVWAGYNRTRPADLEGIDGVELIHLDVTSDASVEACLEAIVESDGKLDVLVNNAGIGLFGSEEMIGIEESQKLFDINFFGCQRLIQAAAPTMKARKYGKIINVSSTSGVRAVPGIGMYAATKFALEAISESLAVSLSPWNIKVSLVEPGPVKTPWSVSSRVFPQGHESFISSLHKLCSESLANGQDPREVGELIFEIATEVNPDMRYQTSEGVKKTVGSKHHDLTGNQLRDQMLHLFKDLLEKP
ncbi:MAG: SDR family oxidoreductase [Simkaniaceae bacterium]|nr:SDR family oxidoreductase [Simkaniaceae bacterium]